MSERSWFVSITVDDYATADAIGKLLKLIPHDFYLFTELDEDGRSFAPEGPWKEKLRRIAAAPP